MGTDERLEEQICHGQDQMGMSAAVGHGSPQYTESHTRSKKRKRERPSDQNTVRELAVVAQQDSSQSSYPYNATDSALSSVEPSENKTVRLYTDEGRGEIQRISVLRLQ